VSEKDSRGLLAVQLDIDPQFESEFNRWYAEEHFGAITAFPGVLSGRRFRHVTQPHRYLALYDLESTKVLDSPEYAKAATSPWTQRISQHFTGRERNVWVDITPTVVRRK
jgi:hypothetical protein